MASWGSCDFHELRDLNERIKAAASEPEMDAFYTGLLDEMMNGLLTDVKELTPVDRGHLRRNWFITKAKRSGKSRAKNSRKYASCSKSSAAWYRLCGLSVRFCQKKQWHEQQNRFCPIFRPVL